MSITTTDSHQTLLLKHERVIEERNHARSIVKKLQDEVDEWQFKFDDINFERDSLNRTVTILEQKLYEWHLKFDDMKFERDSFERQIPQVMHDMDIAHDALTTVNAENTTLKALIADLQQALRGEPVMVEEKTTLSNELSSSHPQHQYSLLCLIMLSICCCKPLNYVKLFSCRGSSSSAALFNCCRFSSVRYPCRPQTKKSTAIRNATAKAFVFPSFKQLHGFNQRHYDPSRQSH